ncbi:Urease [Marasmius sp. AFHP31]|nr:Urease [Marasmius sp. AFHP31]
MEESVNAGAIGMKLREDWGTTPEVIRVCLDVAEREDVQVNIHTDTLNESGFVESEYPPLLSFQRSQPSATAPSTGGHAPDIITVCSHTNVHPSSTNPTWPFALNALDEHLDMLMVCHHLSPSLPEDIAFAGSRIRAETIAAEDVLQDIGAISMISSDSQAMGRVGEVVSKTWRTAERMRGVRGALIEEGDEGGEGEGKEGGEIYCKVYYQSRHNSRYLPPPDLVLWKPSHFGAKPEIVIKGSSITFAQMGEANASIPTVQPVYGKPMFLLKSPSVPFVFQASLNSFSSTSTHTRRRRYEAVKGCREVKKSDMKLNSATPRV